MTWFYFILHDQLVKCIWGRGRRMDMGVHFRNFERRCLLEQCRCNVTWVSEQVPTHSVPAVWPESEWDEIHTQPQMPSDGRTTNHAERSVYVSTYVCEYEYIKRLISRTQLSFSSLIPEYQGGVKSETTRYVALSTQSMHAFSCACVVCVCDAEVCDSLVWDVYAKIKKLASFFFFCFPTLAWLVCAGVWDVLLWVKLETFLIYYNFFWLFVQHAFAVLCSFPEILSF